MFSLEGLLENWPTKLLAAAIAIALWFYVLGTENPHATRTLTLPVVAENVPEGLAVISVSPQEAEVRVRGRIMRLEQTDFARMRLRADLSGAKVGENTVPVAIAGLPLGVQALPGYPTVARVQLDKIIERSRPVQLVKLGDPAPDFAVQSMEVEPAEVLVRGATSIVARVARVVAVVDVSGLNSPSEAQVSVEARDTRDVVVNDLTFVPPQVMVRVKLAPLNTRTVPVRPILTPPRRGYEVSWVRVQPPVVTLAGEGEALAKVEWVSTGTIDISGLTTRKSYVVPINMPAGVRALGGASVTVTVAVRPPGRTAEEEENGAPPAGAGTPDAGAAGEANPQRETTPETGAQVGSVGSPSSGAQGSPASSSAEEDAERVKPPASATATGN